MSKLKLLPTTLPACTKRLLISTALVFASAVVSASDDWQPQLNTHYQRLPVATESVAQTITLYCWVGSPSCYQLETALRNWAAENDLTIAYQPVVMRPDWRLLAKARLVAREMMEEELVTTAIYERLHENNEAISSEEELFVLIESLGVSASRFANLFYSPEINASLKVYETQAKTLGLKGIPSVIVNNLWLMDASMLGSSREFLNTVEFLLTSSDPR